MNKQQLIKWGKRIGISLLSLLGIYFIGFIVWIFFFYFYIPYKDNNLYNEGINHPENAAVIAKEILDSPYMGRQKAIDVLKNAADKGFEDSQVMLAKELEDTNKDKSAYWYLQAAKKGNSEAQWKIGINYKYGLGVKQDFAKAIKWLQQSSKNNNANAQYELGNIYLSGLAFYDSYPNYFERPYSRDFNYTHLIYKGNNVFIAKDNWAFKAKDIYLEEILSHPYNIYVYPNIKKAQYYWKLAANQGLEEAKDALEKVYDE